ncbi:lipoprotein [uncultured Mailhella sp.]|uniref:LptM family lipoprotein n=1 Tax=uncultured Mailhella sp. TaxID=1981031 RepID=UPI0025D7C9FC|nr:YMGG-like glycine zipper-containing protein [uncultured Mailhella sp.]
MSKVIVCLLSVMLVFSLTGCGTKQAVPVFQANYYPECYDPIARLCKDQDNSQEIKGAATGAVVGALGGALIGGLTSKDWKGAAIGATAGALAGGVTGFFSARLMKINDRNERLKEYQNILGESSRGWDLERASVEKAYKCYRDQITVLTRAAKAKKISKEEFLARMKEIQGGIENINTYWADSQTRMDERLADGEAFLKQQEQEDLQLAKAKQRQAQKDLQKVRNATTRQKNKMVSDTARVNKAKAQTEKDLQDAMASVDQLFGVAGQLA